MDRKIRDDLRKYLFFLNIIVLFLVAISIFAENNEQYDYGEIDGVLISSYDINADKIQNQYDDEVQKKNRFLERERLFSNQNSTGCFYK